MLELMLTELGESLSLRLGAQSQNLLQRLGAMFRSAKERSAAGPLNFDYKAVGKQLRSRIGALPGDSFATWSSQVGAYRNFLHRTAHAILYRGTTAYVLKPNIVVQSNGWVETLERQPNQFDDLQALMAKHFAMLTNDWAPPLWDYFLSVAKRWRAENIFDSRVGLTRR